MEGQREITLPSATFPLSWTGADRDFLSSSWVPRLPLDKGCNKPGSGGVPNPAIPYNGPQPGKISPGASKSVTINSQWTGRIFNQNGKCGQKGEKCTVLEYSLGKPIYQNLHSCSSFATLVSPIPSFEAYFDL